MLVIDAWELQVDRAVRASIRGVDSLLAVSREVERVSPCGRYRPLLG